VIEFSKRKDAEKAAAQFTVDVHDGAAFALMNMEQLTTHYTQAVNSHKRAAQSKVVRMMVPNVDQREVEREIETDSLLVPRLG
jgi:hypothetical protein